jgi:hypothetical protein
MLSLFPGHHLPAFRTFDLVAGNAPLMRDGFTAVRTDALTACSAALTAAHTATTALTTTAALTAAHTTTATLATAASATATTALAPSAEATFK